jgi:hypothetical protein
MTTKVSDDRPTVTLRSAYSLWSSDYSTENETRWLECPVERVTPKFIWCWGRRVSRAEIDQYGHDSLCQYYVEAQVPADEKRVTLAEQAEEWLRRKAEILAADETYKAAEQRSNEAEEQGIAAADAYIADIDNAEKRDALRQATEALKQTIDAREEAWERRNRYTLSEVERATNGWRHPGEAAR